MADQSCLTLRAAFFLASPPNETDIQKYLKLQTALIQHSNRRPSVSAIPKLHPAMRLHPSSNARVRLGSCLGGFLGHET